jgi:hypothetical protein
VKKAWYEPKEAKHIPTLKEVCGRQGRESEHPKLNSYFQSTLIELIFLK